MNAHNGRAKSARIRMIGVIILLAALLLSGRAALAQNVFPVMDWWVIGSGGGAQTAGSVTLDGTLGQPVVGESSAGEFTTSSGYLNEATANQNRALFLPLVQR